MKTTELWLPRGKRARRASFYARQRMVRNFWQMAGMDIKLVHVDGVPTTVTDKPFVPDAIRLDPGPPEWQCHIPGRTEPKDTQG